MASPDGTENKTIKLITDSLTSYLVTIFNQIIITGKTPKQWKISEIILIYKKGDKSNLNNYRPISLTSNISKVFLKVI